MRHVVPSAVALVIVYSYSKLTQRNMQVEGRRTELSYPREPVLPHHSWAGALAVTTTLLYTTEKSWGTFVRSATRVSTHQGWGMMTDRLRGRHVSWRSLR